MANYQLNGFPYETVSPMDNLHDHQQRFQVDDQGHEIRDDRKLPRDTKNPSYSPLQYDEQSTSYGNHRRSRGLYAETAGHASLLRRVWIDILLLLLPGAFIVLAILAASINDRQISRYGNNIIDALKIGPTVYPIVFAAIAARFMKKIASVKAERGASLGFLEQLMGSQSLAGSIETAFALRIITPIAGLIVLLWLLSPIGGQSSLRLVSIQQLPEIDSKLIWYWGSNTSNAFGGSSASHYVTTPNAIQALIAASLIAQPSSWMSPVDTWNNAKIPLVKSFVQQALNSNTDVSATWYMVDSMPLQSYSSLIGIPLTNVPSKGQANFSIENSFVYTDCQKRNTDLSLSEFCSMKSAQDAGACTYNSDGSLNSSTLSTQSSIFLQSNSFPGSSSPQKPQRFSMQYAWGPAVYSSNSSPQILLFDCPLYSVRVEANIVCKDAQCAVKRIRRSQVDRRPSEVNGWNAEFGLSYNYLSALLEILTTATGTAKESYGTPIDYYLAGNPNVYVAGGTPQWTPESTAKEAFSTRMTRLLNAAWIASQNPEQISGDITTPIANFSSAPFDITNNTAATITNEVSAYKASWLWISLLLAVSSLLLACAVCNMVLGAGFITGPEILGRISTLTRDSVQFPRSAGIGSALDGWQRARALQHVNVQLADIAPHSPVGRIAFVPVEFETAEGNGFRETDGLNKHLNVRIRKGRMYA